MIGHTAFLVTTRRLAPGVVAPPRRRKPSQGAQAYARAREHRSELASEERTGRARADIARAREHRSEPPPPVSNE
jgi:tRNA (adenine57-N1/adenine58-N1)-methyltransferase